MMSPGGPLLYSLSGQANPAADLQISFDGGNIASICRETGITIWDNSGRILRTIEVEGWFL